MRQRTISVIVVATIAMAVSIASSDEITTGVAKISSKPTGASVYIDGNELGKTPVFVELKPGKYQMMVSMAGYPPKTETVIINSGKVSNSHIFLRKEVKKGKPAIRVHNTDPGGPDSGPGTVNVATDPPGFKIFMDTEEVPKQTPVSFDISAGPYTLTVVKNGQIYLKKTVFVRAGRTMDLDLQIKNQRKIDETDPWR